MMGGKPVKFAVFAGCVLLAAQGIGTPAQAAGPRAARADSAELTAFKKAIRSKYDLKEKAWAAGDAESIVTKFYSADAISAGEGEPETTIGLEAIRPQYQQFVKDVSEIKIESVYTFVKGDAGWDWTNFYHHPKPEKTKDYPPSPLRILFLWERVNGQWYCKGEMFIAGKFEKTHPQSH